MHIERERHARTPILCTPVSEGFPRSTDEGLEWLLSAPPQEQLPLKQTSQNDSAEWQIYKD